MNFTPRRKGAKKKQFRLTGKGWMPQAYQKIWSRSDDEENSGSG
jgi:hypothetical protein